MRAVMDRAYSTVAGAHTLALSSFLATVERKGTRRMAMDPAWVIDRLESNAYVFQGLVRLVRSPQAIWKPSADKWSMLEVMNYLGDQETDDFRIRLRLVLEDAARQWPPIVDNQFNKLDLRASLHRFTRERGRSIEWLRTLPQIDWQIAHSHEGGVLRAGDLLCSWLAHDLIHIRQINRLHYEYHANMSPEFSTAYGGIW